MMVELTYHLTLESVNGTTMKLFGFSVDTAMPAPWLIAAALLAIGAIGSWYTGPAFKQVWDEVNTEIEELIRRAEA
jgi:branched-chain amino acid transport system permease protein